MLEINLDINSSIPLYIQIADEIKKLIAIGKIKRGLRLLSPDTLSDDLMLDLSTVLRAYKELERDSVIGSVRGLVYYVIDPSDKSGDSKNAVWEILVRDSMQDLIKLGIPKEKLSELVEKVIA